MTFDAVLINACTRYLMIGAGVAFFVSMVCVSARFFMVADDGARLGKRVIGVFVLLGVMLVVRTAWRTPSPGWLWSAIATVLFVTALVVFWAAWHANHACPLDFAFSKRCPRSLVQSGPYRWIRHPFYASYCCGWLACFFAVPGFAAAVCGIFMTGLYVLAARREESIILASVHAEAYAIYQSRAGMFLPRFGKLLQ